MKPITLYIILALSILLVGCNKTDVDKVIEDLPITISRNNTEEIDIDIAITNAHNELKKWLPNSIYAGLVYFGKCDQLHELEGKYTIIFKEIHNEDWRFKPKVYYGNAIIYTTSQTLNIYISDETDNYPSLKNYTLPSNKYFRELIGLVEVYIQDFQRENSWKVLCDPKNSTERKCNFDINSESLEINNSSE
jgi:hypothetical protein